MHNPYKQQGVALIESLVSLLILAIGVLGLLGIQLRTLTDNQTSNYRQVAVRLADDLFERVKANPGGWANMGQYATNWGAVAAAGTNCATTTCNATQKAAWDVAQWKAVVTATLPSGDATAFISPTDARQIGVMIAWRVNERSMASTADDATYVAPFTVNVTDGGFTRNCPANRICHIAYAQP
jgi:type IV pilus assembly protein PilV